MSLSKKLPTRYMIITYVALIWALLGVLACASEIFMIESIKERLPKVERNLYSNASIWVLIVYALTVLGNVFGVVLLLKGKKLATIVFDVVFGGIAVLMFYNFSAGGHEINDNLEMVIPFLIIGFGWFMTWFSKKLKKQGYLSEHHKRRKRKHKRTSEA